MSKFANSLDPTDIKEATR